MKDDNKILATAYCHCKVIQRLDIPGRCPINAAGGTARRWRERNVHETATIESLRRPIVTVIRSEITPADCVMGEIQLIPAVPPKLFAGIADIELRRVGILLESDLD